MILVVIKRFSLFKVNFFLKTVKVGIDETNLSVVDKIETITRKSKLSSLKNISFKFEHVLDNFPLTRTLDAVQPLNNLEDLRLTIPYGFSCVDDTFMLYGMKNSQI